MKKKQVFISYKSEEFDEALWVKNTLEAQGITCWMAPMCITGGASYAAEIPAAINNCTVFVLILSEKVQQSKWVPRELDQAINAGKTIMPFMLEDCELKDEFKFYLSNIQRYYAYQDKLGTMEIMSREIRAILGIPDPVVEKPAAPESVPSAAPAEKPKEEPKPAQPPKQVPVPKAQKPSKKKKNALLPIILAAAAAVILIPVLVIVLSINGSKVTFANTTFRKGDYTLRAENQTITAADMQALSQFKELHRISLKDCIIETDDLSAFSNHPLWELELEGCVLTNRQLQSIDFEAMHQLSSLNLSNNTPLTDLTPILPVADTLDTLSIGNTKVASLEALENFTEMTTLSIENLGIESLESLSMMVYLEELNADGNLLRDLTGLENTSILEIVSLRNNQLQNADCLANSAATLQILYLDGNNLVSLDALSGCAAVKVCSVDDNQLTSIDWAGDWKKLTQLSAANNKLENEIAAPPQSEELHFLDLSGNRLTNFRSVYWDKDVYVTVDLSNNQLTSVTLPTDQKYKLLALHGNPLTSISFTSGMTGITLSIDYFEGLDTATVKGNQFNDFFIVDCPANRIVELEQASNRVKLASGSDISDKVPDPEFPEY